DVADPELRLAAAAVVGDRVQRRDVDLGGEEGAGGQCRDAGEQRQPAVERSLHRRVTSITQMIRYEKGRGDCRGPRSDRRSATLTTQGRRLQGRSSLRVETDPEVGVEPSEGRYLGLRGVGRVEVACLEDDREALEAAGAVRRDHQRAAIARMGL